jgi:hypothetical protein
VPGGGVLGGPAVGRQQLDEPLSDELDELLDEPPSDELLLDDPLSDEQLLLDQPLSYEPVQPWSDGPAPCPPAPCAACAAWAVALSSDQLDEWR